MNRFKTTDNGKLPLVSDDLRFVDAGIRDALKGLVSLFGLTASNSFKITGCVVSNVGLVYSYTAGYICYLGEILPVVSGSVTIPGSPQVGYGLYWDLDLSFDPAGLKVFENGVSHDTYEVRKAKLVYGQYPTNQGGQTDYMPAEALYLKDKILALYSSDEILNKIIANEEQWVAATLLNSWTNQGTPFSDVKYKKDRFGTITIKGSVMKTVPDNTAIIQLPVGHRPTENRIFGDTQINTSGEVRNFSGLSGFHLEITFKI